MILLIIVAIVASLLVIPLAYLVFLLGWNPTIPAVPATAIVEDVIADEDAVD